jgi:eukaryotic translation initiation factor 2C
VTRVEDETEQASKVLRTKSASQKSKLSLEPRLPQRPGFGTRGKEVVLWTNYFKMMANGDLLLHRYSIEVVGDRAGRAPTGKKLKRVVQLFLEEHLAQYRHDIATDFKSNLFSKTALDLEEEYAVTYRHEDEDDPAPNAKVYKVRVQPTGMLTVSELMDHLTSSHTSQLFGSKEEIIQALDIVVGHYPKAASYIASIGANRHYRLDAAASEKFDLGAGLTALRGFFVSVRAATARILVNVQVKHGAFFDDGPLDRLMYAFQEQNRPSKVRLWNFLKGISVDVIHIVKQNKAGKRVPRLKQLNGFATRDDGQGQEHPPRVRDFGAGSKEVEFFWTDSSAKPSEKPQDTSGTSGKKGKGKGKGKGKAPDPAGPSSSPGKYISVFNYFKQSKYPLMYELLSHTEINGSNRLPSHYNQRPQPACRQCWQSAISKLLAA